MWAPSGMSEDYIFQEMDKVISGVMRDFTPFSIYRGEELRQQCFLFGIEAMSTQKYDKNRPIGGFLRTSIINRCISLSRDKHYRREPPCNNNCPFSDPQRTLTDHGCTAFDSKMKCEKFKAYHDRNEAKKNIFALASATPLFDIINENADYMKVDNKDYIEWLSTKLTKGSRQTLADIILDKAVSNTRLDKLRKEVSDAITKD